MSEVAGSHTPEQEALAEEIVRTREQLGETVEALAAKADVKGRAQRRAAQVKENLRGKARTAKDKVTGELREGHRGQAAAAAAAVAVLILAWLAVRGRPGRR